MTTFCEGLFNDLKISFLSLITLVLSACSSPELPNIVFILVDDLGWKDLGCYGSEFYDTPNLDELAARSVRFTNAYSASPVCSPTRAAIMTGKHPARVNITDWIPGMSIARVSDPKLIPPEDIHNLPLEEFTLAEAFREKGYKTFFAGKWHLGETAEFWPEYQGFEVNKGGVNWGSPRRNEQADGYYSPYGNPRLENGPEGEYLTDRLTDESLQFIESAGEQPFFLYLAYYTVHTPIQGCDRYDAYYQEKMLQLPDQGEMVTREEHDALTRLNQSNAKYAAMVRSLDANVGRLLEKLEGKGMAGNTIIVFTSDNGGLSTIPQGGPTAVVPLRAGKGWCYEGGIRVPLLISYPDMEHAGKVCDVPAISMDFYPTLLELAGMGADPDRHVDGSSLVPFLRDPAAPADRTLVWHYPHYHGSDWRPGSAIREGNWKLIEFYETGRHELYDLENDLEEKKDLTGDFPEVADRLKIKLHEVLDGLGANYPVPRQTGNPATP
jgi:arylsulfatase A-like enzyme